MTNNQVFPPYRELDIEDLDLWGTYVAGGWVVQPTTLSLLTHVEVELGCDKNICLYKQVVVAYPEIN